MKQEYIELLRKAVSDNFYDKDLELYTKNSVEDEEGGNVITEFLFLKRFKGNAQVSNSELLKKQYGLEIKTDYIFTFNSETEENEFIKFNNKYYQLVKVLNFESHTMALGVETK